jgi:hypothetical protein
VLMKKRDELLKGVCCCDVYQFVGSGASFEVVTKQAEVRVWRQEGKMELRGRRGVWQYKRPGDTVDAWRGACMSLGNSGLTCAFAC